ncbi:hypothetical protein A9Q87_11220 [Flavobacteriales bacterium 34_180_T64]|nr:hypothetical protein A9Q87_11220 [Flavobacteriales bacterium 34_180_T64]
MKFTCSVNIKAPLNLVTQIFEDPEQQKHFQDGFISKIHISGNKGNKGAVSQLNYKKLELIETIIENNLPNEFRALYEHKHTTNTMYVKFIPIDDYNTQYFTEIEYTKFNGFIINILVTIAPSLFKKQVQKWLNQFKLYVESQHLNNQR